MNPIMLFAVVGSLAYFLLEDKLKPFLQDGGATTPEPKETKKPSGKGFFDININVKNAGEAKPRSKVVKPESEGKPKEADE